MAGPSVSSEKKETQSESVSARTTLSGPIAYYDRSSFELLIFRAWELMCQMQESVFSTPKNAKDHPPKKESSRTSNLKSETRGSLAKKEAHEDKGSVKSVSPVSKIILGVAALATLATTLYDRLSTTDPDVGVVKLNRDQASDAALQLGLPQGPPELLKSIFEDLKKKAEKTKKEGGSLEPLEQKRLDHFLQKQQKGEL